MVSLGNSAEVLKLQLEYKRLEAAEQDRAFQREFELKRLEAEQKKREYEREREASEREDRREVDLKREYSNAAFEYSLRTDSDLGSDATPTLQAFYYFARSLEENMDATRKAVVAVVLAEDQALQNK
ncbi:unnamed protein product [Boreogadus saida]